MKAAIRSSAGTVGSLVFVVAVVGTVHAPEELEWTKPPILVWEGQASWYGPQFHGRTTANGEQFNMFGLTAAHRTLPMGSRVRLVNPQTGRARVIRINDRGPYIGGREMDVSYRVARDLGFLNAGLAQLRIELLEVPASTGGD